MLLLKTGRFLSCDIERYGSGIIRVRKICKEYGIKEPDFNELANGFQVVLYNEKAVKKERSTEKLGEGLGEKLGERLGENSKAILGFMLEEPHITIPEIAKKAGISETAVQNNIKKLKDRKFIERVGPDKVGYWKVNKNQY